MSRSKLLVSLVIISSWATLFSQVHPTESGERGTCLVAVWNIRTLIFAADSRTVHFHDLEVRGPDYLQPLKIARPQTATIDCKLAFSEAGILVSATGTMFTDATRPVWDAKKSAAEIIRKNQGIVSDTYLEDIARKWQDDTELAWQKLDLMHHTHFIKDHDITVALVLAAKTVDGHFTTVFAAFETLRGALHRVPPIIDHPPPDGHTGIVPYGICANYSARDVELTQSELASLNNIAAGKRLAIDADRQSVLALEFLDWSSKISSRLASENEVAIVAPPYDLAYEILNETKWNLRPSTSGCSVSGDSATR